MAKTAAHPRAKACKSCETPNRAVLRAERVPAKPPDLPAKPIYYLQNPIHRPWRTIPLFMQNQQDKDGPNPRCAEAILRGGKCWRAAN